MLKALSIALLLAVLPAAAHAECVVTDPTGTPLNIRNAPNGRIVGTLRNGTPVEIQDVTYAPDGRPWAYIGIGWVYREFVTCYN
jgi:hypothetical protein